MPKKKKKQDNAKPAKSKSARLPKQIAGVGISKDLRNAVEPVLRFASHPLVSDTLAAALLAGADALTGKPRKKGDDKGGKEGAVAATGGALGAKARNPVGLLLAIAAGELASHIVSAYRAPLGDGDSSGKERRPSQGERRASHGDRRKRQAKPRGGKEGRSGQDRRSGQN